jgi:predicted transcriptional regulator
MKYRSRTDIIAEILRAANKGALQSKLMYGASLTHTDLKEYLRMLQERGMLKYESESRLFTLTERGLGALSAFDKIDALMDPALKIEQKRRTNGGAHKMSVLWLVGSLAVLACIVCAAGQPDLSYATNFSDTLSSVLPVGAPYPLTDSFHAIFW